MTTIYDRCEITSGVLVIGIREPLRFTAPLTVGIKQSFDAPLYVGLASSSVTPPRNVYAAHIGGGVVAIVWDASEYGSVDYYELHASRNLAGPYFKHYSGTFRQTRGQIYNVPVGSPIYLKLRAVSTTGDISEFTQVKQGLLQQPTVTMQVVGVRGSIIQQGAIFTSLDAATGRLIAATAVDEILIDEVQSIVGIGWNELAFNSAGVGTHDPFAQISIGADLATLGADNVGITAA